MANHWTDKYVGLCCKNGEFDCADLVSLVQREVFGRTITIPGYRQYTQFIGPDKFRAMSQQLRDEMFKHVQRTETPKEGDGVLIKSRGYFQHIGVYSWIANEAWILHAADLRIGPQVILQKVRDMAARGLTVEGYYTWI